MQLSISLSEYWRVMVAILLTLIMSGGTIAMTKKDVIRQVISCASDESMLVYPLYDRRGTVTDHRKLCGSPHRGCILRSGQKGVYDCSPFMAPDALWAGGQVFVN